VDERLVELIVEDVLPRVGRELREKHRECAERYPAFWDTMTERFARLFRDKPEETMARFLALGDEECDWQGADFMTRDRRLDNFIGRELAREVRKVLIQYGFFEADYWFVRWEDMEGVQTLREKNQELAEEVRRLKRDLVKAEVEREKLLRKNRELLEAFKEEPMSLVLERGRRIEELEAELQELRDENKALQERLAAVEVSRGGRQLASLCAVVRAALKFGAATPVMVAEETGISLDYVYDLLRELLDLGVLKRRIRGFYELAVELDEGNLELELALRRLRRWEAKRSSG
jgi:hypothetical protein